MDRFESRHDLEEILKLAKPETVRWSTCCHKCGRETVGLRTRMAARRWRESHVRETDDGHIVMIGVEFETSAGARMGFCE